MLSDFEEFFVNAQPGPVRKLEPYAALIRQCRRRRWSLRRIIAELKKQKQITVSSSTLWAFLQSQKPAATALISVSSPDPAPPVPAVEPPPPAPAPPPAQTMPAAPTLPRKPRYNDI
jgi:hypothetical protein